MQKTIDNTLAQLAGLLGPLSPFAKAIVPGTLGLVTGLVDAAFSGQFNTSSLTIAGSGLVLALVAYLVPNLKRPAKTVPAAPAVVSRPVPPASAT